LIDVARAARDERRRIVKSIFQIPARILKISLVGLKKTKKTQKHAILAVKKPRPTGSGLFA
jgi:hypothetical protein